MQSSRQKKFINRTMNATVRASRHTRRASASHAERSEFSEWFADAHLKSDMAAADWRSAAFALRRWRSR